MGRRLKFAVILTALVLVGELIGGFLSNSLALLSDAGHVFTDVLALSFSWFGVKQAEKPGTARMTYGYHRVGILIALVNALSIILICLVIFYEAYRRLQQPQQVHSALMMGVASIGLVANLVVVWRLRADQRRNLNVRSAFLHALGDALSSLGVIGGATIIYFTQWFWVDPVVSIVIGLIIAVSAARIIKEAITIFLEATPQHIDPREIVQALKEIPGVNNVHDLHVWSIAPQIHALSCHLLIDNLPLQNRTNIVGRVNQVLKEKFNIHHTTVQLDCDSCNSIALYCNLSPEEEKTKPNRSG